MTREGTALLRTEHQIPARAGEPSFRPRRPRALRRRVSHLIVPLSLALLSPGVALAQGGQELPPIKVDLPPQPNFNVQNAPEQYPTGELSVYGLRKKLNQYMDKDVQVKAYLLEVYECPAELRKCNDELAAKNKKAKTKALKKGAAVAEPVKMEGGCRPCDQPHFFMADTPNTKIERALLVADYPTKDWKTGKPKPLTAKTGEQYVVTGTFAINSIGGFAASDGLIIHKKLVDSQGKVITEGNAVLPPDAQDIKLEGRPAEKVGAARVDGEK